jgi:hypothetical protein
MAGIALPTLLPTEGQSGDYKYSEHVRQGGDIPQYFTALHPPMSKKPPDWLEFLGLALSGRISSLA